MFTFIVLPFFYLTDKGTIWQKLSRLTMMILWKRLFFITSYVAIEKAAFCVNRKRAMLNFLSRMLFKARAAWMPLLCRVSSFLFNLRRYNYSVGSLYSHRKHIILTISHPFLSPLFCTFYFSSWIRWQSGRKKSPFEPRQCPHFLRRIRKSCWSLQTNFIVGPRSRRQSRRSSSLLQLG